VVTEQAIPTAPPRLRRVLGFWGTASLSIGVMAPTLAMAIVGPEPARLVGRAAPPAFALAAVLVLLVSAGFVRLSARFASAGSVYAFVGGSIGPRTGAFTGWTLLGTYLVFPWVSVAGITVFGGELLRLAGLEVDWYIVALVGWIAVGWLAAGGLRPAVRTLIGFEIVAVLLILALMAVVLVALVGGDAPRGQRITADVFVLPAGLPPGALVLAATAAFLAFCGFESAGSLGEEAHRPRRAIPRALLATVALGAVFYVACVSVQVWGFGTDPAGVAAFAGSAAPLGELALAYAGPAFAAAIHTVALVSAIGAGLGCVLVAVRMLFALGRDGLLPARLGALSARTATPRAALAVELAVGLVLITAFRVAGAAPVRLFFVLATIGVLHLLVMYAITNVAAARQGGRAAIAPALGAVVAAAVLVESVRSAPLTLPLVVLAWLALGVGFALLRGHAAAASIG
jgi:amino acid transporter